MKKRVLVSAVVVAMVFGSIGYYGYSAYGSTVVQTTVVTGKITGVQSSGIPKGANGATTGASYFTISINSTSFSYLLPCVTFPYYSGMSVKVADQLMQSGQHQYLPDMACKGSVSAFKSLHLTTTSSSSTTT
jgi:hypothetical protein